MLKFNRSNSEEADDTHVYSGILARKMTFRATAEPQAALLASDDISQLLAYGRPASAFTIM